MNNDNDQKNNDERMSQKTNMSVNSPAPIPQNNDEYAMTTAIVNPNFMQEVETLTPQSPPQAPIEPVIKPVTAPAPVPIPMEEAKKKQGLNIGLIIAIIILAIALVIGGCVAYLFFWH